MRKHILATLLVATAGITGINAQSYTINGTSTDNGAEAVLMKYARPRQKADTAIVKNGTYTFAGETSGATFAEVHIGSMSSNPIFLEGNISIDAAGTISGGKEQQCLNQWSTRVRPKLQLIEQTMEEYNEFRKSGKPVADSITHHYMGIYQATMQELVDMLIPCFEEYTDMKFPAFFLNMVQAYLPQEKVLALADENPAYLEVPLMAALRGRIEGWRKQAVGTPFTDLAMPDTAGTVRHLSEFVGKGNYVLIDFWASWCGPCRKDMPHVKELYAKYHSKGFDIVGISFDNNHKAWTAAINKMELPWHHISDLKGWESLGSSTYGINAIPATLLIGPDGKIAAAGLRGEALDKKLAEIYGE